MEMKARTTDSATMVAGGNTTLGIEVALLTGGGDKHYALGLATALASKGAFLDVIGSDDLDCPEFREPRMNFLNLRGDQETEVGLLTKVVQNFTSITPS